MSARSGAAAAVTRVLGTTAVERAGVAATRHKLRILAYHGVPDRAAFARHVAHLSRSFHVVSGAQVAAAAKGGSALPERAVWITFDDGDPTVVANGLPVLAEAGVTGTVFVCPSLIDAGAPPWWRVVEAAGEAGAGAEVDGRRLEGRALVRALKVTSDQVRRRVIDDLVAQAPSAAVARPGTQAALTLDDLGRWLDAGQEIGNHTWDHPCLDRCDPTEQAAQLRLAHEWLQRLLGRHPGLFAYPNGDHTEHAESVLVELGYDVALLFDHALASLDQPPLRLSRLRIDADAPMARARAVLSGAHGALLGAVG